jgi:hypothetical protein
MSVERNLNARPGSAYDTWHKAGWDAVQSGRVVMASQVNSAALAYHADGRECFQRHTVVRAFTNGANQALSSFIQ